MTVLPIAVYIGTGRRLVAVRFFVPFMAGYVVLIGHGLASLRRGAAVAAGGLVVLLCAVPLTYFFTTYAWSYDHRRVARAIGQAAEPGDALFVVHPFETFYYRWYLDDTMPMQGLTFTALEEQEAYVIKPPPLDLDRAESRIRAAAGTHPRLWIVGQSTKSFASDADAEGQLFAWLDAHARRLADFDALTDGDPHIRLYDVRTAFGSATAR
jgi:hypothetical protein